MTDSDNATKEVQHATATVRIAFETDKAAPEEVRRDQLLEQVKNGEAEIRYPRDIEFTKTETMEEAGERHAAEAEAAAEAKMERRRERHAAEAVPNSQRRE